ncbi:Arylsulfatase [Sedimentisphaera cyanobacteriorum]|uniref:Arylsulfatase n=1 Tax=Sedimentisphaera cyanobacteriorum TaxID=1940790 RepID=A0A1Q2HMP6_9BACT|nr:sulfatase-like hydrolase/transferase [Sedimentisphaera cyanobacteriorum]AQQ08534.1 Arylsulfatase [Sedimentisphaera cyanobacteriorum]
MTEKIQRRSFLKASGALLAGSLFPAYSSAGVSKKMKKPNILYILVDDMGWSDVGYHDSQLQSPNIDRLVKSGAEMDCFYVQPQCTPTRVALMTGKYPSRFGNHCIQASNKQAYPKGTQTMASMLKKQGYDTAVMGKWHMGSKPEWGPNHHGFDYSYGSLSGAIGMYDHRYRLDSEYVKTWHRNSEFAEEEVGHVTDLVTREAVNWLKEDKRKENPFFLYMAYHSVHIPLVENHRTVAKFDYIKDPDRRLMAAAVYHLDQCVGRLLDTLEELGIRENTLIVFSSDNGGLKDGSRKPPLGEPEHYPQPNPQLGKDFSMNDPLRGGKCTAFEGGIRVPACVNWKGVIKPQKMTQRMHIVDWMPTIAHLTGCRTDPEWDGKDMWKHITGKAEKNESRDVYIVWHSGRTWEALISGDWKIVRNGQNSKWQLYDLSNDPYETVNLADTNKKKFSELVQIYKKERSKDAKGV